MVAAAAHRREHDDGTGSRSEWGSPRDLARRLERESPTRKTTSADVTWGTVAADRCAR